MKIQHRILTLGILSALIAANALADAAKPTVMPKRGPATLKEVMTLVIDPSSAGVFNVGSQAPKNDAEWKTLQGQALTLSEVANTLTSPSRAKDKEQWMQFAKALQTQSRAAFAAAMAKNVNALTDLSDTLYQTCADCHEKYIPKK